MKDLILQCSIPYSSRKFSVAGPGFTYLLRSAKTAENFLVPDLVPPCNFKPYLINSVVPGKSSAHLL